MRYCECGCGTPVAFNRRFVNGHNSRMSNHGYKPHIDRICKCGCGGISKDGDWMQGHHKRGEGGHLETLPQQYCLCGCGEITKPGNTIIMGHGGVHLMRVLHLKKFIEHQRKAGILGGTESVRIQKENNLEEFLRIRRYYAPIAQKIGRKRNPEKYRRSMIKAGIASVKANRENKPYIWKGVHFDSKAEMKVAKILFINPIDNVNCHIVAHSKVIDFYLSDINLFVEYHPWDMRGLTKEEYYNQRVDAIEKSKYSGTDLVVITNFEEAEMINWIKEEC